MEQKELTMPSHEQHLKQAKHNQELIGFIETNGGADRFCDWCVTIAFYSALHYFEAILPVIAPKLNKNRRQGFILEHYDVHIDRQIAMRMVFEDIYVPYIVRQLAQKRLEEVIVECRKAMNILPHND